jgi:hypothetical protein
MEIQSDDFISHFATFCFWVSSVQSIKCCL